MGSKTVVDKQRYHELLNLEAQVKKGVVISRQEFKEFGELLAIKDKLAEIVMELENRLGTAATEVVLEEIASKIVGEDENDANS